MRPASCGRCGASSFSSISLVDEPEPITEREPGRVLSFSTFVTSCPERGASLQATLASLEACGWGLPDLVVMDDRGGATSMLRCNATWRRTIQRASQARTDFVLLCEDDVIFGRHFPHNVRSWPLLQWLPANGAFYASLYNYGSVACAPLGDGWMRREVGRHIVADPAHAWGAQAVVTTPRTARFIARNWDAMPLNADVRMLRLAAFLTPIYFHVPSLVDHVGKSTWGAVPHRAPDFDPEWRA